MMILGTSTFINAYWQADGFGKTIFLALFVLSLISWFFILHKIWVVNLVRRYSKMFQTIVEKHTGEVLTLSAENLPKMTSKEIPHPFAHIYIVLKNHTVDILNKNNLAQSAENFLSSTDIELLQAHLQSTIIKQRENLEKNLYILSTTYTLAPFMGLLGTVWGILTTFSEMQGGGNISSNAALLGGLSTALATTVIGLLIAIPALIAYNYLKNASRLFAFEMHDFAHLLLSTVEMQYRKVDVT